VTLSLLDPTSGLPTTQVYAIDGASGVAAGTVNLGPGGHFIFTPTRNYPNIAAGDSGTATFSYRLTEVAAPANTSDAVVTITVTPAADTDSPPVAANDDTSISEFVTAPDQSLVVDVATGPSGPLGIGVLANDTTDPADVGDPAVGHR
jgi:hypothetical protein